MLIRRGETRLFVNINDLRIFNEPMSQGLLMAPLEFMPCFEIALKRITDSIILLGEIEFGFIRFLFLF